MDHESGTARFKDWIAAVVTVSIDFSIVGIAGWMTPYNTGISILGCAIGLGLIFWIGPQNLALLGGNSQLVPWLPPNGSAPATSPAAVPAAWTEPDPSKVPIYYRIEWRAARWFFFAALSPVLLMIPLRKALDRLVASPRD